MHIPFQHTCHTRPIGDFHMGDTEPFGSVIYVCMYSLQRMARRLL